MIRVIRAILARIISHLKTFKATDTAQGLDRCVYCMFGAVETDRFYEVEDRIQCRSSVDKPIYPTARSRDAQRAAGIVYTSTDRIKRITVKLAVVLYDKYNIILLFF